ncbi:hypothetical protein [Runella sp.]|uniref:hypothetical protein n=1 Tax=Runella sp. TaxID=1960881 RepID=UPI003D09ED61
MESTYHEKFDNISGCLKEVGQLYELHLQKNMNLGLQVTKVVKEIKQFFEKENAPSKIAKCASLLSEIDIIDRGYHPNSFLKIEHPKREMQSMLFYKILQEINALITYEYEQIQDRINQAEKLIETIILSALQNRIIDPNQLSTPPSGEALEELWKILAEHEVLFLIQRKALCLVFKNDCLVSLSRVLSLIH